MEVKEYTEHPVAVKAVVWDGIDHETLHRFCGRSYVGNGNNGDVIIYTYGTLDKVARLGDYIVEYSKGQFDVMKAVDFNKKYEELRYA